ncbi:MAG: tetratricopeptide repeat protein [Archangiaceae bacterium]|nr:tetratricopeptide repeat protein [Archangiaceae bacterium]
MALFKLGKGYRVVTTEQGARVIDPQGEQIPLNPLEVQILARASIAGLQHDAARVPTVIRRLAHLGVLEPAADQQAHASGLEAELLAELEVDLALVPPTPVREAATPHVAGVASDTAALGLADVPPPLRADLQIAAPQGGLVNITNPTTGKTFALYDFEASLARMLDGSRTMAQILEGGGRLGIPGDLSSINQFVRQLGRYGFLGPRRQRGEPASAGSGPWPSRQRWDESVRALYQAGVRLSRQGRYAEAVPYFEAMLQQSPENPEAAEMLAEARIRALTAPPNPIAEAQAAAAHAVAAAEPLGVILTAGPPPARQPVRPQLIALLGVAGLAALAYGTVSQPSPVVAPLPTVAAPPPAPRPDGTDRDAAVALAANEEVEAPTPDASEPAPDASAAVAAAVEPAEQAVEVEAADDPAVVATVDRRGRATMGQLTAAAAGALKRGVDEEQRVKRGQPIGTLSGKGLVAPIAGLVRWQAAEGAEVAPDQLLAKILYHEAYVMAWVAPGEKPQKSWRCAVDVAAQKLEAPCLITGIEKRARGWYVTVTAEPTWVERSEGLRVRLTPAP